MKFLYLVCNQDQHIEAYLIAKDFIEKVLKLSFKVGVLLTVDKDGSLPRKSSELDCNEHVIIDNGAYKNKGVAIETSKLKNILLNVVKKFENVRIFLPDVIENSEETIKQHVKFLKEIPKDYWKYCIPVLQGKEPREYTFCFKKLIETIGTRKFIENFRLIAIGGLKKKRELSRQLITALVSRKLYGYKLKIHVFGADLELIENCFDIVHSFDTANWTYNSTTGHGISIITRNYRLGKVYVYHEQRKNYNWSEILANEIIKYLMVIQLKILKSKTYL